MVQYDTILVQYKTTESISQHGWGTAFSHSFHIGGAFFYLSQKIDPEIVCLAGHWMSLAYKAYIYTFEQIASHHLSNVPILNITIGWVCIAVLPWVVCLFSSWVSSWSSALCVD